MMNKEEAFKRIILIIMILSFLLWLNFNIAQTVLGEFLAEYGLYTISILSHIVLIYELIMLIYGLIKRDSYKQSLAQWKRTVEILEPGVDGQISEHLDNRESYRKEDLEAECSCYLMSYVGKLTGDRALDFLGVSFASDKEDPVRREELSYFFLSNLNNSSVKRFLKTEKGTSLFDECQLCSKAIVERKTSITLLDDEKGIKQIANEFLHMCVQSVQIDSQETIHHIKSVLSWICSKLDAPGFVASIDFKLLLVSIPKLEKKFEYFGVNDNLLDKYIKRIRHSRNMKRLVSESVNQLCEGKNNLQEMMCNALFISAYHEMFNVSKQGKLRKNVRTSVLEYENVYHKQYSKGLNILISAIPLGSLEDPHFGLTDRLLSVMSAMGGKE